MNLRVDRPRSSAQEARGRDDKEKMIDLTAQLDGPLAGMQRAAASLDRTARRLATAADPQPDAVDLSQEAVSMLSARTAFQANAATFDLLIADDPWMPKFGSEGWLVPLDTTFGYKRDADIFDSVMAIDVQIALGMDAQVDETVPRDLIEHVIKERHT